MAHVFVLRSAPSFVQPEGKHYNGQHERVETAINKRKYAFKGTRDGYNIVHSSEVKLLNYRVKEPVIKDFVNDLRATVLNPTPNNMTLRKVFGKVDKQRDNVNASVGPLFKLIQWVFKWLNRKKTTASFILLLHAQQYLTGLNLLGLLTAVIIASAIMLNPLKPVPVYSDREEAAKKKRVFASGWCQDYVIGTLKDIKNDCGEEL